MKTRWLVGGGALVVAGLLVALLLATRGGKKAPSGEAPEASGAGPTSKARTRPPVRGTAPDPAAPAGEEDDLGPNVDRIEVRDGGVVTAVREHEARTPVPSPVAPQTVAGLRRLVAPLVRKCVAPLRREDPPVKGRLQVAVTISVSGGRVQVTEVDKVTQNNMDEPEVVDCVTKAFQSATFDAPEGQADIAGHMLHVPFVVP